MTETETPEPDDTAQPPAPPAPDMSWDSERQVWKSTSEPEPRSLLWWKQKAVEHEATGVWLHAEMAL